MDRYMRKAIEEAYISENNGDIPVGAVIVKDDKIISYAHNEKELQQNAVKHAEVLAIEKACNKMKTWHLDDCTLYTTMEPCLMCSGAVVQSRIKKVVFGIENEKFGYSELLSSKYKIECIKEDENGEILKMIKNFFEQRR